MSTESAPGTGPRPVRSPEIEALFATQDLRAYAGVADQSLLTELHPKESTSVPAMAQLRQAEFATARFCARAAMAELGVDGAVPRGEGGEPVWPAGITGSISHTRGYCVAVACSAPVSVGIDVEEVARMHEAVERRVLVASEHAALSEAGSDARRQQVATIFAAKEAFYKAHFAITPRYLGFDVVAVTVCPSGSLQFVPTSQVLDPNLLAVTSGRWQIKDGRVLVGAQIEAVAPAGALPSPR